MRSYSLFVLAVCAVLGSYGCRTSQQSRRSQNTQRSAVSGNREMDSLLLIEDRLVNVIDSLTGMVDDDRARIRTLEHEVTLLRARIEGRIPAMPPPTSTRVPPPPPTSPQAVRPEISAERSPLGPPPFETRYTDALHNFNDGQYATALKQFHDLANEDRSSAYVPNYDYWQGESLFALHRYNEALQQFSTVVQSYPNSLKADDAQFKIAESYERMNLPASARQAYEQLLKTSPDSEYAARARARLKKL